MSESSLSHPPESAVGRPRLAVVAAYAVLGVVLLWSRLFQLGHSFWLDELSMVQYYVRAGPREIIAGNVTHELMAILAWAMTTVTGESEIALRLLSAVPFVAGVALVTFWLHVRVGALSGVLFLFLATVSPLLLDVTRQARGYGLAFLAMSVVVVAALEATRTRRAWPVVAMCAAGVIGTWTLPQLGFAFVATGLVVAIDRRVRLVTAIGLIVSVATIVALYAPSAGEVRTASQIQDGLQIGFPWVLTAPVDQILLPALLWIDGTALVAGVVWLPLVLLVVVVAWSSPLVRDRASALVLCSGAAATVVALWVTQAYVIPRYLSFLLVPLFILVATGAASILGRITGRPAALRTAVCLVVIAALGVRFALIAPDVVGLPREANRDAAEVIARESSTTPVLAYMRQPDNLVFYVRRPVEELEADEVEASVCGREHAIFYVMQPFALEEVSVPCLTRAGVRHYRFRQYARGNEMNVWFVPPETSGAP